MAEIRDLNVVDANNTARFPESQAPSTVNNGARSLEGMLARAFEDTIDGWLPTGGSGSAYTLSPNRSWTASATMDHGTEFSVEFHAACAASPTLNVDTTSDRQLRWGDGTTLTASDIVANTKAKVKYDSSLSCWIVIGTPFPANVRGPTASTDNAIVRFDGTDAKKIQNSVVTIADTTGSLTIAGTGQHTTTLQGSGAVTNLLLERTDTHGDAAAVGDIYMRGRDSGGALQDYALIRGACVLDNAAAETGSLDFYIGDSTGSVAERLKLRLGLYTPNATGGDKGADTINASAVYDDNVLLTCYVFDAALDGSVSLEKWDGKVPNIDYVNEKGERVFVEREHEPLRKFTERLGGDEDPLDLEKYIAHWKTKRHLTSLPNEANFDPLKGLPTGAWIQRLIETVEIQAVHIAQLHERVKALEAK